MARQQETIVELEILQHLQEGNNAKSTNKLSH